MSFVGGKASIEVREMSKIALERTTTARDAILLMGALAEEHGFYAADWSGGDASKGEGGEALTVVDKTEAWVFHVLADDTGASAVWAAQRVKDDHVSSVSSLSFHLLKVCIDCSIDLRHCTSLKSIQLQSSRPIPSLRHTL
jgi:dipeptidase